MRSPFDQIGNADPQAEAVLAYLSQYDGIEESWSDGRYGAEPWIAEWHNFREVGYVIMLRSKGYKRQINIAFFEHRNSDNICAIAWEQKTLNPPTIDTAEFGDVYKDKYDVSHSVGYGKAQEMADWIYERLVAFWSETSKAAA